MKKFLALILVALTLVSACCLASCGGLEKAEAVLVKEGQAGTEEVLLLADALNEEAAEENETMKIYFTARGNSIVCVSELKTVSYATQAEADEAIEILKQNSEEQGLLEMVKVISPSVESVIYDVYDQNGDLVVSYEIK